MKSKRSLRNRNRCAIIILMIGSFQMLGYLTGIQLFRGLGLASGIAPFPKVFCESKGYEPFAATFVLEGTDASGERHQLKLTAERYAGLQGPYNRRNVYGATLAYAPRLPENMRETLLERALAPGAPLRRELKIPSDWQQLRIRITAREGEATPSWQYDIPS